MWASKWRRFVQSVLSTVSVALCSTRLLDRLLLLPEFALFSVVLHIYHITSGCGFPWRFSALCSPWFSGKSSTSQESFLTMISPISFPVMRCQNTAFVDPGLVSGGLCRYVYDQSSGTFPHGETFLVHCEQLALAFLWRVLNARVFGLVKIWGCIIHQ